MAKILNRATQCVLERSCSSNGEQGSLHEQLTSHSPTASQGMWLPLTVFLLMIGMVTPVAHAGDTDEGFREYSYAEVKNALQKLIGTSSSEELKESSEVLLDKLTYIYEPDLSLGGRGGPSILPSDFIDLDPTNPQRAFQLYCSHLARRYQGHKVELLIREYTTCREYDMGKKGLPPETMALLSLLEDDKEISINFSESVKSLPQKSAYQKNGSQCLKDRQRCLRSGKASLICSGFLAACLVSGN